MTEAWLACRTEERSSHKFRAGCDMDQSRMSEWLWYQYAIRPCIELFSWLVLEIMGGRDEFTLWLSSLQEQLAKRMPIRIKTPLILFFCFCKKIGRFPSFLIFKSFLKMKALRMSTIRIACEMWQNINVSWNCWFYWNRSYFHEWKSFCSIQHTKGIICLMKGGRSVALKKCKGFEHISLSI